MKKLDANIIRNNEAIQLRCNKLEGFTHDLKLAQKMLDSKTDEIDSRLKGAEHEIVKINVEAVRLDKVKTELSLFQKTKKKFELKDIEHDVKLFKCTNHVVTHDNFYDKYLPIRT